MTQQDRQLDRDELGIKSHVIQLYKEVDKALGVAIDCLLGCDTETARFVVSNDKMINRMQHQIEEVCVTTIARQQPMAKDLRDLISNIAIAGELERIGDYAAGIADIVLKLNEKPHPDFVGGIEALGQECRNMLTSVMQAYEDLDETGARSVAAEEEKIDQGEKRLISTIFSYLNDNPRDIEAGTYALWIVHSIERVGDRVTNIAERIVYMTSGEMVDLNA
jgi:phosphate transport system protein